MRTSDSVRALPFRERVGLVINIVRANDAIQTIVHAEQAGVRQLWAPQGPTSIDALTVLSVAATQTSTVRLGTSILPTYPRHPHRFCAVRPQSEPSRTHYTLSSEIENLLIMTASRPFGFFSRCHCLY